MRRVLALMAAAMMWAALLAPTAALAKQPDDAKPAKEPVCHYDSETEAYKVLNLSGKALEAHVRHSDPLPGDSVPGMPGFTYDDETCEPHEHIYAVAYIDINPSDGAYNADVDVLISKLVEGPGDAHDGSVGEGDLVITNQYPLDPSDPTAVGTYGITEHVVASVSTFFGLQAWGEDTKLFWWRSTSQFEFYQESCAFFSPCGNSSFQDEFSTSYPDLASVTFASPSDADTETSLSRTSGSDDSFIDVEIDLNASPHS